MDKYNITLTKNEYRIKGNSKILLTVLASLKPDDFDELYPVVDSCINLAYIDDREIFMKNIQELSNDEFVLEFEVYGDRVDYPHITEIERKAGIAICIYEMVQVMKRKNMDVHQIKREIFNLLANR